jgi:hypothetical protein
VHLCFYDIYVLFLFRVVTYFELIVIVVINDLLPHDSVDVLTEKNLNKSTHSFSK